MKLPPVICQYKDCPSPGKIIDDPHSVLQKYHTSCANKVWHERTIQDAKKRKIKVQQEKSSKLHITLSPDSLQIEQKPVLPAKSTGQDTLGEGKVSEKSLYGKNPYAWSLMKKQELRNKKRSKK